MQQQFSLHRQAGCAVHWAAGVKQSLLLSIFTAAGIAVCALMVFERMFMALLFGYLAFSSYTVLQQMSGRGGFGGQNRWH